jgi:hypothetical protein
MPLKVCDSTEVVLVPKFLISGTPRGCGKRQNEAQWFDGIAMILDTFGPMTSSRADIR